MTIDEAQLRLGNMLDFNEGEIGKEDCDAMRLGIEALQLILEMRAKIPREAQFKLPSEAKEPQK